MIILAISFETDQDRRTYRHTASHILAQAVLRLFPHAKLAIGPAIENGFYYDFDVPEPFQPSDLEAIEKEMKAIIKENLKLERMEVPRQQALDMCQGQPYKTELINELPEDAVITFYKQGEFTDLCMGPHLDFTGRIKAFKLLSASGSYWRGDEKNKMLQRIYGTAFPNKTQLNEYLEALNQAKLRDHNKLGRELGIFTTSELIGQGLPLLMPKGAKLMQILQRMVEDEEEKRGYVRTMTPSFAKKQLYEKSGHWQHYKDGMFIMGDMEKDEDIFALRPMTCPFQFVIYNTQMHSYRDLPIRYGETSTLFRNESSGEMHGLIRLRQFTISEGHIVCTREQLADEFKNAVDLIYYLMDKLGMREDVSFRFSKRDPSNKEKYIDDEQGWNEAEDTMKHMLDNMSIDYVEAIGEAAFYGPKLDIQCKNVHGKEDTIITVQIDFQLAEKFDMSYVDSDSSKKRPIVIHRTSIGCYERTLALLIEKYAGAFPLWLSPVQVMVTPISEGQAEYAIKCADKLRNAGFRVEQDLRSEKIGYKIREAQLAKINYMVVVGDKEVEAGLISVRSRGGEPLGQMDMDSFIDHMKKEL